MQRKPVVGGRPSVHSSHMQCIPVPVIARQVVKQPLLALVRVQVQELQFDRKATPQLVMLQVEQLLHR